MTDRNWPNMTWREKTAWERAQSVACSVVAAAIGAAMFVGILWMIGIAIEVQEQYSMERHYCLKNASNGLEIEQCQRQ